ncbi:MAG: hypothetical protein QNJ44_23395 [Rhodobacter sp.]|nr:hypothetical protein [Rhodobacter sp.]
MLEADAGRIFTAIGFLNTTAAMFKILDGQGKRPVICYRDIEQIISEICEIRDAAQGLDLPMAKLVSDELLSEFTRISRPDGATDDDGPKIPDSSFYRISGGLERLQNINYEASTRLLLGLDAASKELWECSDAPFGSAVVEKFPGCSFDIEEASKCLAVRRSTAAVLHLSRALEAAVQRIANHFEISNVSREWGKLLSDIDAALKKITEKEKKRAWSEVRSSLWHVKEAWRNPSMHPIQKYTPDEAEDVYRAARAFMRHLARLV